MKNEMFYEINESPSDVGFEYTLYGDYNDITDVQEWLYEHYSHTWGIEWMIDHKNRYDAINIHFNIEECDIEAAVLAFKLRWL